MLTALSIPGFELHRVARDAAGEPSILLGLSTAAASSAPAAIQLQHVLATFDIECRLKHADGTDEQGRFAVLRLRNADGRLRRYFLSTAASALLQLGQAPRPEEVTACVMSLVELFRSLGKPPRKSVQGLWAELFIISSASEPSLLVTSWHGEPSAIHDFVSGTACLEVKSSTGPLRSHVFSFEQLCPALPARVVVASLILEPATPGVPLTALVARIRRQLANAPSLLGKLEAVLAATLGDSLIESLDVSFDYRKAQDSVRLFNAENVPKVAVPIPPEVTDVHFRASLDNVTPAEREWLLTIPLFAAVVALEA